MTENSDRFPEEPAATVEPVAPTSRAGSEHTIVSGSTRSTTSQSQIAGLVLLINTVVGGLGTLYVTTRSAVITLVAAVQVLLIIVVVLVVQCRTGREAGPRRRDERSG